ncbi:hypothetical protein [Siccirubricoccus phaeus]|uniref:hypothetical protein n=1 Tax=Siccirubricoccus phaeus TaxID=2595053 RepID=UPI0011F21AA7|nr:hypothetical protein [Siccirubricoccus phaeus]
MGGLFSSPRPVIVQPTPAPAPTPAETISAAEAAAADAASQARSEARSRAARGIAGTIATSARGVLDPAPTLPAAARKSLLGE